MKQAPECQYVDPVVMASQGNFKRIREPNEPAQLGDVVLDTRGQFVLSGVRLGGEKKHCELTCVAKTLMNQ